MLQGLHCSKVHVQRIHRAFAVWYGHRCESAVVELIFFVGWGKVVSAYLTFLSDIFSTGFIVFGRYERSFSTNVYVKIASQCIAHVCFFCEWKVWHSERVYEVVYSFKFLTVRFFLEHLTTVSRITNNLKEVLFPVLLYRSLYSYVFGEDVLSRVNKWLFQRRWKLPSLINTPLPFLLKCERKKGLVVASSTNCTLCGKPENIEYMVTDCLDAIFFWDVLQWSLQKDLPVSPDGTRLLSVQSDSSVPYDLIMALDLHSI